MTYHLGMMFSTRDRDNDEDPRDCVQIDKGAWWQNRCQRCTLNGYYYGGPHLSHGDGVNWKYWTGGKYSLKFTEMKIRPNNG
jgi:hypothetical protein